MRMSAGARLTVMRCPGNSNPELRMAVRTRSRLSRTLASGRPTIVKTGRPNDTSTSTMTASASTPTTAALRRLASTPTGAAKSRPQGLRKQSENPMVMDAVFSTHQYLPLSHRGNNAEFAIR